MNARNPRLDGRRVGLIVPSVNATIEPELAWIAPPGLSFHASRVMLRETTPDGLRAMNEGAAAAADLVASVSPDVVAYACTSGTFLEGMDGLRRLVTALEARVRCPVVATSAAMIEALRALGVRRVALATPYLDTVNALERAFLEAQGFAVVSVRGLDLSGRAIREVAPDRVYDLACSADDADADGVFVSCTDLRALEAVESLERALGKPVVTSNQATLWAILRALGRTPDIAGFGRLLRTP